MFEDELEDEGVLGPSAEESIKSAGSPPSSCRIGTCSCLGLVGSGWNARSKLMDDPLPSSICLQITATHRLTNDSLPRLVDDLPLTFDLGRARFAWQN